jgi:site-specific DNA-methyltransferase (adenine-specific)
MKELPDKSIDCFICDLPYGCLEPKRNRTDEYLDKTKHSHTGGCAWDVKLNLTLFWEQVRRLAKSDNTPVIHFCNTRFGAELIASNPSWFRYDLVWNKSRKVGFLSANKQPMRSHENIYIFSKKGAYYKRVDIEGDFPAWVGSHSSSKIYNLQKPEIDGYKKVDDKKRCIGSVVDVKCETNKGQHPTQKPVELYKWLLQRYVPEGGTILDPTAGSFNSCKAAKELGLHAIGIEKDLTFYEKASSSLSEPV